MELEWLKATAHCLGLDKESTKEAEQCKAFQEIGVGWREAEMKLFLHFYKKAVPVIVTDSLQPNSASQRKELTLKIKKKEKEKNVLKKRSEHRLKNNSQSNKNP